MKDIWKAYLGVVIIVVVILLVVFLTSVDFKNERTYISEDNYQVNEQVEINNENNSENNKINMESSNNVVLNSQSIDGLKIEDLIIGTGDEALSGKEVAVNYLGILTNGQKFDSSYDRGQAFTFMLGGGQVIQGWDKGVVGMKVGGKRRLTIPPNLGYGSRAVGSIPANSTLIFEVELLGVNK